MGQKVNPIGLRLILNKKWQSRWFANRRDFGNYLQEALKIRAYIKKKLKNLLDGLINITDMMNFLSIHLMMHFPLHIVSSKLQEKQSGRNMKILNLVR